MKKLLFLLFVLAGTSFAQMARFDGVVLPTGSPNGPATVAVCTAGGSGGPPCSPLAVIYDAAGAPDQNPFPADMNGHYTFFAPAGTYAVQTYGTGYATTLTTVTQGTTSPTLSGANTWTGAHTWHSTGTNDYIWYLQALDQNSAMGWGVSQTGMPWTFWNHFAVWGNSTNTSAFHIIQERTGLFVYDAVEGESRMEEASSAGHEFAIDNAAATAERTVYYIPNFKDDPVIFYPGEVRFSNTSGGPFGGFGPTENLAEFSEDFTNAIWSATNVTVTGNSTTSPDGTSDADTIAASAGSPNTLLQDVSANTSANSTYTFSVWVKSTVTGAATMFPACNDNVAGMFSQEVIISNQWQQIEITCTFGAGSTTRQVGFNLVANSFYAWGAQLSTGANPNLYVKSTSAVFSKSLQTFSVRDGSLSLPSMAFSAQPGLGFFRPRADDVQLADAGGIGWEYDGGNGLIGMPLTFGLCWGTNSNEDTCFWRDAAGVIDAGVKTPQSKTAVIKLTSVQFVETTVASLPTCNASTQGQMRAISDATAPTYNGTLTGGGAVHVPVYCNGTAWTSH